MKKKISTIILGFFILPIINVTAQNEINKNFERTDDLSTVKISDESGSNYAGKDLSGARKTSMDDFAGVEGSMYLYDAWKDGICALKDGSKLKNHKFRYNIYFQQMQFAFEGDTLAFGAPEQIKTLSLDNKTFIYSDFIGAENEKANSYFQIIENGENKLLLRRTISYQFKDRAGRSPYDTFIRQISFYMKKGDKPAELLPHGKKSFVKLFDKNQDKISVFIKINKLNIRNIDDMKKIISYYNSLNE